MGHSGLEPLVIRPHSVVILIVNGQDLLLFRFLGLRFLLDIIGSWTVGEGVHNEFHSHGVEK